MWINKWLSLRIDLAPSESFISGVYCLMHNIPPFIKRTGSLIKLQRCFLYLSVGFFFNPPLKTREKIGEIPVTGLRISFRSVLVSILKAIHVSVTCCHLLIHPWVILQSVWFLASFLINRCACKQLAHLYLVFVEQWSAWMMEMQQPLG